MLEQHNDMLLHACSFVLLNDHHCSNWQGNNYIVCVESAVGPLHHVDVGNVANILEVHAVSVFKLGVHVYPYFGSRDQQRGNGMRPGVQSRTIRTGNYCQNNHF